MMKVDELNSLRMEESEESDMLQLVA